MARSYPPQKTQFLAKALDGAHDVVTEEARTRIASELEKLERRRAADRARQARRRKSCELSRDGKPSVGAKKNSAARTSPDQKRIPDGFAETFVRHGWRGIETAYGSRTSCNKRWIEQAGGDALIEARRQYRERLKRLRSQG